MEHDFWDQIRRVEEAGDQSEAEDLHDRMLATPWDSLSRRDTIEFFTELLRLDELFPDLLGVASSAVLAKIQSDSRRGYCQDQIAKADIIHRLASVTEPETLVALARDKRQDLDTRNAAVRELWEAPGVDDSVAIDEVRRFLKELLERCDYEREPAAAFMIGIGYRLLRLRSHTGEDESLVELVYRFHRPDKPMPEWFRTQATMAGHTPEPRERG